MQSTERSILSIHISIFKFETCIYVLQLLNFKHIIQNNLNMKMYLEIKFYNILIIFLDRYKITIFKWSIIFI